MFFPESTSFKIWRLLFRCYPFSPLSLVGPTYPLAGSRCPIPTSQYSTLPWLLFSLFDYQLHEGRQDWVSYLFISTVYQRIGHILSVDICWKREGRLEKLSGSYCKGSYAPWPKTLNFNVDQAHFALWDPQWLRNVNAWGKVLESAQCGTIPRSPHTSYLFCISKHEKRELLCF